MILFDLVGYNEGHPAYQQLHASNINRQYDFLEAIVQAALAVKRPMISTAIIKALNYHAIACLHINAGEYRPSPIIVHGSSRQFPEHYQVPELMNDFINNVNRYWDSTDYLMLSAYCLWRLNHIHPFVNGNGRTARALCYFVVCAKLGVWLHGRPILPELIHRNREEYVALLEQLDQAVMKGEHAFNVRLKSLGGFIGKLLRQQLASIGVRP